MPLTPIMGSDDPLFNHEAAQRAFETVMKMDEDSARAFTTAVVVDTLWQDIERNRRTLDRRTRQVIEKRAARVQSAIDSMVSKGADAEHVAALKEALEEITKSQLTPWDYGYRFDENKINRDRSSGRFTAKIAYNPSQRKPLKESYMVNNKMLPNPDKSYRKLKPQRQVYYQQGYSQIATFLNSLEQSGFGDADEVRYTVVDDAGRGYRMTGNGTQVPQIDWATERVVAVEARPKNDNIGTASFGLVSALGGSPVRAGRVGQQMNYIDNSMPSFANDWTGAGADGMAQGSSNARLYDRVATGSGYLAQVAPAGSKLQMAAAFANFTGRQGPEAEKVLGPTIRRTMYRYRGTEKKPDTELVNLYDRARGSAQLATMTAEEKKKLTTLQNRALGAAARKKGKDLTAKERASVISSINASAALGVAADTGSETARARSFAVLYDFFRGNKQKNIEGKIPERRFYDLQLKSGHTPPSEGVIIDKNGKIVTQAIGYGDDHYLPFNLKNLKGLNGGEYWRTRSVGGPTVEDIYTGLVMGAQGITVTSRSGTFIIEFDDTFRGTRRYNDKAGRMVERYGKILDAVQSEQAERMDIEPSVKRRIRADVERAYGAYAKPEVKAAEYKRRVDEYKTYPGISEEDELEIQAGVRERLAAGDERGAREYEEQARNARLEQKAYNWKLNGEGYMAAINALREQFPYYIKNVDYIEPRYTEQYSAESDRGYVKPKYNRPAEALEGYFDESIAGEAQSAAAWKKDAKKGTKGKYRADTADYQNWRFNPNNPQREGGARQVAAEPEPGGVQAGGTTAAPSAAQKAVDEQRKLRRREQLAKQALEFRNATRGAVPAAAIQTEGARKLFTLTDEEFSTWFTEQGGQRIFEDFFAQFETSMKGPQLEGWQRYRAAQNVAGRAKYDPAVHRAVVPSAPFEFTESPYLEGADPTIRDAELRDLSSRTPKFGGKKLSKLHEDAEFKAALTTLKELRRAHEAAASISDDAERMAYIELSLQGGDLPADLDADLAAAVTGAPEKLGEWTDNVHRAWALRKLSDSEGLAAAERAFNAPDETPPTGPSTPSAPSGPSTPSAPQPRKPAGPVVARLSETQAKFRAEQDAKAEIAREEKRAEKEAEIKERVKIAKQQQKIVIELLKDQPENRSRRSLEKAERAFAKFIDDPDDDDDRAGMLILEAIFAHDPDVASRYRTLQ